MIVVESGNGGEDHYKDAENNDTQTSNDVLLIDK